MITLFLLHLVVCLCLVSHSAVSIQIIINTIPRYLHLSIYLILPKFSRVRKIIYYREYRKIIQIIPRNTNTDSSLNRNCKSNSYNLATKQHSDNISKHYSQFFIRNKISNHSVCVCVCVCVCVISCLDESSLEFARNYTQTPFLLALSTHKTDAHVYMCTHVCVTHTHTHVHVHVCTCVYIM